jgi:DNA polymerase III subunit beta
VKFRVERDVFSEAVAWAARSLPQRPSVPVLAGVMIDAGVDGLVLSGFDYETSARVSIPAEIAEEGKALVSGRLLADISRSLPSKPIDLGTDGTRVSLACGSARFSLQTMPVEDYPALPELPTPSGTVRSDVFAAAVGQAVTAAGRDDMLPVLTGIRMEIEGSTIALMATDRYRLSLRECQWSPEQSDLSATALVPARVLADTAKSLTSSGDVTIALASAATGDGLIGFEGAAGGGLRRTTTRLLDGEFPKVRALFPSESVTVAHIDTPALIEAVRRVSLVAERNTPVRLSFSEAMVTLEAGSGDEAQATESLEATVDGADISIGFNPSYLLDGLGALDAPVAHLAFTQSTRPAALAGASGHGEGPDLDFRYLLMPVRLQG